MEKIQFSEIEISRLRDSDSDELSHFFCGNDILDGFFHQEVYYCHNCHFLTAYCVRYRGRLIAAFTLANDSLSIESDDIDSVQQEVSEDAPTDKLSFYHRYFEVTNDFPAVNIGHLAVDKDFQSKGIGSLILKFVLFTFLSFKTSGCTFITVDSLNNSRTNAFYLKNKFEYQTQGDYSHETRRMYLPLKFFRP